MIPADPALRRRILLALALIILLPFAFLFTLELAVNYVLLPLFEQLGYGPYYGRFYVSPGVAVLLVMGGLIAQAWLGPRTIVTRLGARRVSDRTEPGLVGVTTRLATQADLPPPDVAVARNATPNAAAVDGPTGGTIVVTSGLVELLDDEELEAVLAHEIAHLKHRDATVMTVAWLLPTITYYLAIAAAWVLYGMARMAGVHRPTNTGGRGAAHVFVIMSVTALVTIFVSALFWAASVLVHRVLSRYREFAADRAAAALTGRPAVLATALRKIDATMPEVPDRDLRRLDGGAEALYFAPLEGRAFTSAELISTDIFPDTHPSTSQRLERLESITEAMT